MIFRVRFDVAGGHVHCGVFCAPDRDRTFAKCGDLCVRKGPEFAAFMKAFGGADFISNDPNVGIHEAIQQ